MIKHWKFLITVLQSKCKILQSIQNPNLGAMRNKFHRIKIVLF